MDVIKVSSAVSGLMADLCRVGIGKNGRNEQQKFKFRAIDDMYGVIAPLLVKNKLLLIPSISDLSREARETRSGSLQTFTVVRVAYRFVSTEDGSFIEFTYAGEAADSGDKSTSKALTMAFKYFLIHSLCIPLEGMDDGDSHTVEDSVPVKPAFFLDAHLANINQAASVDRLNIVYRQAVAEAKAADASMDVMQSLIDAGKQRKAQLQEAA